MANTLENSSPHPALMKAILALAGVFILVLASMRLRELAGFLLAVHDRVPLLLMEPGVPGDFVLLLAFIVAACVFLLPRKFRVGAWWVLLLVALAAIGLGGRLAANGGSAHTPVPIAHALESRGYARCPAGDEIRGAGRETRGAYVAEAWTQPGACPGIAPAAAGTGP